MPFECKRLHELIYQLPEISWPFDFDSLPLHGIYFFHEKGEAWAHGRSRPRIVRVGTVVGTDPRRDNFRKRVKNHYMGRRSNFARNIARVLLQRDGVDPENLSNLKKHNEYLNSRGLKQRTEDRVARIMQKSFSFRWIEVDDMTQRLDLEKAMIGTLARCGKCGPSSNWMGRLSPKPKTASSGLWLNST